MLNKYSDDLYGDYENIQKYKENKYIGTYIYRINIEMKELNINNDKIFNTIQANASQFYPAQQQYYLIPIDIYKSEVYELCFWVDFDVNLNKILGNIIQFTTDNMDNTECIIRAYGSEYTFWLFKEYENLYNCVRFIQLFTAEYSAQTYNMTYNNTI